MTDETIRKTLDVPLTPDEAFALWTAAMSDWWPLDTHSLSAGEGALPRDVSVEPREGGQIVETRHDGVRVPWGRITAWEPGRRLAVAWHVGREEAEATDLDIVFAPIDTGTRVILTHGGFARHGETASALRENYRTGWDLVLGRCFAARCRAQGAVA